LVHVLIRAYSTDVESDKFQHTIKWLTGFVLAQAITNGASLVLSIWLISDIKNGLQELISSKIKPTNQTRFTVE
jgi:hypothetical protein